MVSFILMDFKIDKKFHECGCIGEVIEFYENEIRKLKLILIISHPQCDKKHFLPPHKEKDINLLLTNSSNEIYQIENKEIPLPRGMYLMINPNQIFAGKDKKKIALPAGRQEMPKEDVELVIHPSIFENVLEELNLKKPNCGLEFDINPQRKSQLLENVMKVLISSCKDSEGFGSTLLVEQSLLQLATVLLKEHPNSVKELMKKDPMVFKRDARIQKAIEYIKDNYNKKITLQELAIVSSLSWQHLIELFKKETGKTPVQFINEYRIKKSIELLKNSNITIEEICSQVGYNDERYFRRIFKYYTGVSPSHLRRTIQP
jgi:AraC-like DNA-binding protein